MTIIHIALVTLQEMSRRRLVLTAAVLTLAVALLTSWGFYAMAHQRPHGIPRTHLEVLSISAVILTLIAYMFNLIFALGGAFIAAPTLAGDLESGLLLPLATRPVRRSDIVLGKFIGISVLLCLYAFVSGFVEFGIVKAVTGYLPPHPAIALAYLCGVALTMLAVTLLFSSRLSAIASGVAAVVLYGIAWICGIVGDIGASINSTAFVDAGTVSQLLLPSDAFWRAAVYHLEPAAMLVQVHSGTPFAVNAPPPLAMILWGIAWIITMVLLACWSFTHRDL